MTPFLPAAHYYHLTPTHLTILVVLLQTYSFWKLLRSSGTAACTPATSRPHNTTNTNGREGSSAGDLAAERRRLLLALLAPLGCWVQPLNAMVMDDCIGGAAAACLAAAAAAAGCVICGTRPAAVVAVHQMRQDPSATGLQTECWMFGQATLW